MNKEAFAVNLQTLLDSRGLNAAALAAESGVTAATISRYLNKMREPSLESILPIAKYFGVSIEWLIGVEEAPIPEPESDAIEMIKLYLLASNDDKKVIHAVLNKYRKD